MGATTRGLRGDKDIIKAAGRGSLGAVRHLLRTVPGAAAVTSSLTFYTALHVAAQSGHAEMCRELLAAGARGWTPGLGVVRMIGSASWRKTAVPGGTRF